MFACWLVRCRTDPCRRTRREKGSRQQGLLSSDHTSFDEINDIVNSRFPEAVKDWIIPLGGSKPAVHVKLDSKETISTFGPLISYESEVVALVHQYLRLKRAMS